MPDETDKRSTHAEASAPGSNTGTTGDLNRRLHRAVAGVTVEPDLQTVELRAARLRRRRRVASNVAAASLVAAAAGLGFGVGRSVDNSDSIASSPTPTSDPNSIPVSSSPTSSPPSSTDPTVVPETVGDSGAVTSVTVPRGESVVVDEYQSAPVPDSMIDGNGVWGSDFEQVYERSVNGDRIRVQVGQPWEISREDGPFGDWQPGEGCAQVQVRMTVDGPSVVDIAVSTLTSGLFADPLVEPFGLGASDGRPWTFWLFRSSTDVVAVSTTFANGITDRADVVNGYAVLVNPDAEEAGPIESDTVVEVTRDDGSVASYPIAALDFRDDPDFVAACSPPRPSLPEAGEQPSDPAAATEELTAAFDRLWDTAVDRADKRDLLDDWAGVDAALDQVLTGDSAELAEAAVHRIDELVFTAPDEAWFRYTIKAAGTDYPGNYGYARLVDGHWQFPRALLCQDLALAGGDCGAGWNRIVTPGGGAIGD